MKFVNWNKLRPPQSFSFFFLSGMNLAEHIAAKALGEKDVAQGSVSPKRSEEKMRAITWQGTCKVALEMVQRPVLTHPKDVIVKVSLHNLIWFRQPRLCWWNSWLAQGFHTWTWMLWNPRCSFVRWCTPCHCDPWKGTLWLISKLE